jgi:hypothetical protein
MAEDRPGSLPEPEAPFGEPLIEVPTIEVPTIGEPPFGEPPFEIEPPIAVEPSVEVEPSVPGEPPIEVAPPPEPEAAGEPEVPHAVAYQATPEDTADLAPAPWGDGFEEMSLDEEIPNIDLAREVGEEQFAGERVEPEQIPPDRFEEDRFEEDQFDEEPEPAQAEQASGAARGVFDTETLASIYVSQGFYSRAADIYRRLVSQRPADEDLRARLEDVLARERGEAGPPAESAPPAEPASPAEPAAAAPSEDPRIRQLQTLLEAFRGGRSQ